MFTEAMPFITHYVSELANELHQRRPEYRLSSIQQKWLSFCLTGMLLTGTLCWAAFEANGVGRLSPWRAILDVLQSQTSMVTSASNQFLGLDAHITNQEWRACT